jgi:hypothetical protein
VVYLNEAFKQLLQVRNAITCTVSYCAVLCWWGDGCVGGWVGGYVCVGACELVGV